MNVLITDRALDAWAKTFFRHMTPACGRACVSAVVTAHFKARFEKQEPKRFYPPSISFIPKGRECG